MEAPVPSRKKGYNKPFDLTNVATLNKELANMQRSAWLDLYSWIIKYSFANSLHCFSFPAVVAYTVHIQFSESAFRT